LFVDIRLFDFDLPAELIAQEPAARREDSRMLVVDRAKRTFQHCRFSDIVELLPASMRIIRNNATVLKARLYGKRLNGAAMECLLVQPADLADTWWCMLRPGKKIQRDGSFLLPDGSIARVLDRDEEGHYRVAFELQQAIGIEQIIEQYGVMPLPPYIRRHRTDPRTVLDFERYQTRYADPARKVAAAAPTAGLHFSDAILAQLCARGQRFYDCTLHVGFGTFKPIATNQVEAHHIHRERYEIEADTFSQLRVPSAGKRLAIGTTVVRTLEDAARRFDPSTTGIELTGTLSAEADIYIYPPAEFLMIDALLTNFHLPRSTLLCLVSAFLSPGNNEGIDFLLDLYQQAIKERYRFFSYGDCMLIL
jgi:S-adenosylmethionine:tRNA ribosyltransferase-isomerase